MSAGALCPRGRCVRGGVVSAGALCPRVGDDTHVRPNGRSTKRAFDQKSLEKVLLEGTDTVYARSCSVPYFALSKNKCLTLYAI